MRAAIFTGTPDLSVEDVTPIDPGPADVIVRIGASGVCHSDVSAADGTLPDAAAVHPRPRGRRDRRVDRARGHPGRRRRPRDRVVHPRVRQLLLLPARPDQPLR